MINPLLLSLVSPRPRGLAEAAEDRTRQHHRKPRAEHQRRIVPPRPLAQHREPKRVDGRRQHPCHLCFVHDQSWQGTLGKNATQMPSAVVSLTIPEPCMAPWCRRPKRSARRVRVTSCRRPWDRPNTTPNTAPARHRVKMEISARAFDARKGLLYTHRWWRRWLWSGGRPRAPPPETPARAAVPVRPAVRPTIRPRPSLTPPRSSSAAGC